MGSTIEHLESAPTPTVVDLHSHPNLSDDLVLISISLKMSFWPSSTAFLWTLLGLTALMGCFEKVKPQSAHMAKLLRRLV